MDDPFGYCVSLAALFRSTAVRPETQWLLESGQPGDSEPRDFQELHLAAEGLQVRSLTNRHNLASDKVFSDFYSSLK